MSRNASRAALMAALILSAADGIVDDSAYEYSPSDTERWKRKKWQKPPSGGPGGPTVRLRIPGRKKP